MENFGTTQLEEVVQKFILSNKNGYEVHLLSYGLSIQKIIYPDGQDIVLGFDSILDYENDTTYMGKIVGRNANRLSKGTVIVEGKEIQLSKNEGEKQLHGGFIGFDKKNWKCDIVDSEQKQTLVATYISRDLEEGYPGNLEVKITFELLDDNTLKMNYKATTDKATVVNLTRHDYFNLKDGGLSDAREHFVKINSEKYTVNTTENIPTGEIKQTNNTALHFKDGAVINDNIAKDPQNLLMGFDHNYVIKKDDSKEITLAGYAKDLISNRALEVFTSQSGMQFYTAAYLKGVKGKNGSVYNGFYGFCFEGQHFPDATKHNHFKSTLLQPNQVYTQTLIYKFKS